MKGYTNADLPSFYPPEPTYLMAVNQTPITASKMKQKLSKRDIKVAFVTSQQCSIKNLFCGVNGLMGENNLAAIVPQSFMWHEYQKPCFFGKNCVTRI